MNNSQISDGSSETNHLNEEKKTETDSSGPRAVDPEVLSGFQLYMLLFSISLAGFIYSLDVTIISTAIPVITTHFHTIRDIGWYGSAYLICLCSCAPLTGKLFQFYDSKIMFFAFIIIFETGSLICGVAPSSIALVAGRAISGIGAAGVFSGGLFIMGKSAPKEKRAQLVAFVYVFALLASILAPIIGGIFTEKVSWRWCFYINLPFGGVTLLTLLLIRIPENIGQTKNRLTLKESIIRLDPIGFILFAPSCIMLLIALQWGGSKFAWNSSTIIGLFVGSALTFIVFLVWENIRGDTAMIPLSMLRQPIFFSSCVVTATQYGSLTLFSYYLPIWFQTILGVSPILSGVYFMATAGTIIIVTFAATTIGAKFGTPTIFSIIGNGFSTIGSGLMTTFTTSTHTGIWVSFQVLAGLGRGMSLAQPVNAVQQTLNPSQLAVGTSIVVFFQYIGGAVILALAETDFSSSLRSALKQHAPGVSLTLIFDVGATGIRDAVTSEQLHGVLKAYNQAIVNVYYLGTAAAAVAFLAAWGMGFSNTKKSEVAILEDV